MWVANIVIFFVNLANSLSDFFIRVGGSADFGRDFVVIAFVKVVNTGKVARVAHIHRVGDGLNGWTRIVNTCLQIIVEDVIGVVGGYEPFDWQPHVKAE